MRSGIIKSSIMTTTLKGTLDWIGSPLSKNVLSNSIGIGAVLWPDINGDLVEAVGGETPVYSGLYLALQEGTGNLLVLPWGNGRMRNSSWTWTPGMALFLSRTAPGTITEEDLHASHGDNPVGESLNETDIRFGGHCFIPTVQSPPSVLTLYPVDDEPSSPVQPTFQIVFDQVVNAVSGNISLYLADDTLIEQFDVAANDPPQISGSGTDTIEFTPSTELTPGESYYIQIDSTAFENQYGQIFPGISDETTWNFTVAISSTLWSDDFNRPDGNPGNGWTNWGAGVGAIVSNQFTMTHGAIYGGVYNLCNEVLPLEYRLTVTIPHSTTLLAYWGIGIRVSDSPSFEGVKFIRSSSTWRLGLASSYSDSSPITETGGVPASWNIDQDHTLGIQVVGDIYTIYMDGQEFGYGTVPDVNETTNTGVVILGQGDNPGRLFDDAIVEPVS